MELAELDTIDPLFSEFLEGHLDQHLDFLSGLPATHLKPRSTLLHDPLGLSTSLPAQEPDSLRAQTFTDVLATVASHWGGSSTQGATPASNPTTCRGADWMPPSLQTLPPTLPTRISQDEPGWGASFDLHTISEPPQGLRELHARAPVDTLSYTSPSKPLPDLPADLLMDLPDATQATSADSEGKQQGARPPYDEQYGTDREEKLSEDEIKPKSVRTRGSNFDLERKSTDTPHAHTPQDQKKTRKREKDRIEELQSDIQKVSEAVARSRGTIQALTTQLQAKEETVRQVRAAEDSSLPVADDGRLTAEFDAPMRLSIFGEGGRQPRDFSSEQVKGMNQEVLSGIWAMLVSQMRTLIPPTPDFTPDMAANAQRLCTLQWEAVILHIRSALANPSVIKSLMANGALDGSHFHPPASEFWFQVAESMKITSEQHARLSRLWQSYQDCMGRIMSVRSSITQHISGTMPDGLFGRSFAINFLKAHELMDALKYNLRQEHIALNEFTASSHKILLPLQNARCIVNSWPFWPDIPSVVAFLVSHNN